MSQTDRPDSPASNVQSERNHDHDLELWKHFASFGGEDKNRMVTIASWLFGFSATLLSYVAVKLTSPNLLELNAPLRARVVSILGISISIGAGYICLLYGGYSNRNWRKADDIAELQNWNELLPAEDKLQGREVDGRVNALAWRLARPCKPKEKLAPVFSVFLVIAGISCLSHLAILIWSLS